MTDRLTVGELKEFFKKKLDELEELDEEQEIKTCTNTYFIHTSYFMQFGYAGFLALDEIQVEDKDNDEESEEEYE